MRETRAPDEGGFDVGEGGSPAGSRGVGAGSGTSEDIASLTAELTMEWRGTGVQVGGRDSRFKQRRCPERLGGAEAPRTARFGPGWPRASSGSLVGWPASRTVASRSFYRDHPRDSWCRGHQSDVAAPETPLRIGPQVNILYGYKYNTPMNNFSLCIN